MNHDVKPKKMTKKTKIKPAVVSIDLEEHHEDREVFKEDSSSCCFETIEDAKIIFSEMLKNHQEGMKSTISELIAETEALSSEIEKLDLDKDLNEIMWRLKKIDKLEIREYLLNNPLHSWINRNGETEVLNHSAASVALIQSRLDTLEGAEARYQKAYLEAIQRGEDDDSAYDYGNDAIWN